jgi:hypothetical protein
MNSENTSRKQSDVQGAPKNRLVIRSGGVEPCNRAEALDRPASLHAQSCARQVGGHLVIVSDYRHSHAVISVLGQLQNGILGKLLLNRKQPTLNVWPPGVRWDVIDIAGDRVEVRRIVDACREGVLRRQEGHRHWPPCRNRLADDSEDCRGRIDSLLRAAGAIEKRVADSIFPAHDRLRRRAIRKADSRTEVLVIGIDQCAIVQTAAGRLDQLIRYRIEVGSFVVTFPNRRCKLPSQPEIQCQLQRHSVVVLHVERVDMLLRVGYQVVAELDHAGQPKDEIGQVATCGVRSY